MAKKKEKKVLPKDTPTPKKKEPKKEPEKVKKMATKKADTKKKPVVTKKATGEKVQLNKKPKATVKRDGFKNYNIVRSAVRAALIESGAKYSKKELDSNASVLYNRLRTQFGKGDVLTRALSSIDDYVADFLAIEVITEKVDIFSWWVLPDRITSLPIHSHVIVDNFSLLPDAETLSEFDGQVLGFDRHNVGFIKKFNTQLGRDSNNIYQYIQVFFRDEEQEKEFFYYLLTAPESEIVDYDANEIRLWLENNRDFNLDSIFRRIAFKTPKDKTIYRPDLKPEIMDGEEDEIPEPKMPEAPVRPETPSEKSDIEKLIDLETAKQKTLELENEKLTLEMKKDAMEMLKNKTIDLATFNKIMGY